MKMKIKDEPNLIRDVRSNAVINCNHDQYTIARQRKERQRQINNTIDSVNNINGRINDLEANVNEIKNLLKQVLKNDNNNH